MQSVFDIVRRTGFLMVLTDSAGYVLATMGDESIMERTEDLRFVPGALWSNLSVGTNAISVALDCDTPIQMVGRSTIAVLTTAGPAPPRRYTA